MADFDMLTEDEIEAGARATWERCRSLNERKSQSIWETQPETLKDAWRKGAEEVLRASLPFRRQLHIQDITGADGTWAKIGTGRGVEVWSGTGTKDIGHLTLNIFTWYR